MDGPQLYLITPPTLDAAFPDRLAACLDAAPVAALRLALDSDETDAWRRAADALREAAHPHDLPVLIAGHVDLVAPLGLDGAHLPFHPKSIAAARRDLAADTVLGVHCGTSRHDGLLAGEAGADYIAFAASADHDVFAWWAEMIELPVVVEGDLDGPSLDILGAMVDFVALRGEIWGAEDPAAALKSIAKRLG